MAAVHCELRWNESMVILTRSTAPPGGNEDTTCVRSRVVDYEVDEIDDEIEFDQWDSSWYWDNGFGDLSLSQSGSLNDGSGGDDDDDDVEILPNPDKLSFDGRQPALADISDDDIIVWQDESLVEDVGDVDCDYQTLCDVINQPPVQFSMVYTICRPMFELNFPTSPPPTTFYDTKSSLACFDCLRSASSDDDVTSAECEASGGRQTAAPLSQSPSFETIPVFETSDCGEYIECCGDTSSANLLCDTLTLVATSMESPAVGNEMTESAKSSSSSSSSSTAVIRCIECDRTLAWLCRLRVNQYRQFEACVLIGLCVGLCLGLGTGILVGSLASRQAWCGSRCVSPTQTAPKTTPNTVNAERTSSGGIWWDKFEEIISENAQLKVKLLTIETEIVHLLRQAQGSLSELSNSLEILNDLELNSVTSVEPANRIIDTDLSQLFHDDV